MNTQGRWRHFKKLSFFYERVVAMKVCTACSRTNNKIVPLTNANKCLYRKEKREKDLNTTLFQVIRGIYCGDYLFRNLIMSILILFRIQLTAIAVLFHRCMEFVTTHATLDRQFVRPVAVTQYRGEQYPCWSNTATGLIQGIPVSRPFDQPRLQVNAWIHRRLQIVILQIQIVELCVARRCSNIGVYLKTLDI